jgi:hypothetical protein
MWRFLMLTTLNIYTHLDWSSKENAEKPWKMR